MTSTRILGALLLSCASFGAAAQTYSFQCISQNRSIDCQTGKAQLGFSLIDNGSSVDFRLSNAGPAQGAITDVYFDWQGSASALSNGSISSSVGVMFNWGAQPTNLPGGDGISFTSNLGADSSPAHPGGVDAGEWASFRFDNSYSSVMANLVSGDLRVGLQFKGLAGGGGESFVVTPVPEPETYAMLLAGLGLMGFVIRRRRAGLAT